MSKPIVLVVEDEPGIADTIHYALASDGFEPLGCASGAEAIAAFSARCPALAILDVGLPDMNGFELFRRLQELPGGRDVPMVFLTARSSEIDRVVGLELGADDYIAKPFSPREVCARVRGILRRSERGVVTAARSKAQASLFAVNEAHGTIVFCEKLLSLTRYEFLLLKTLLAEPSRIFPRQLLMDLVWTDAADTFDRTVDTHIKTLRSKLRAINPELNPITTHRGFGYSIHTDAASMQMDAS